MKISELIKLSLNSNHVTRKISKFDIEAIIDNVSRSVYTENNNSDVVNITQNELTSSTKIEKENSAYTSNNAFNANSIVSSYDLRSKRKRNSASSIFKESEHRNKIFKAFMIVFDDDEIIQKLTMLADE